MKIWKIMKICVLLEVENQNKYKLFLFLTSKWTVWLKFSFRHAKNEKFLCT